jgi:hypothetical protein
MNAADAGKPGSNQPTAPLPSVRKPRRRKPSMMFRPSSSTNGFSRPGASARNLKMRANFGFAYGTEEPSATQGVNPAKMEACEPNVKWLGDIAWMSGPTALSFGASAATNVS